MNNKYTGFEKLLKDKLGNFQYPYDPKDWKDFEKKLPKSTTPFVSVKNVIRAFVIAAAVLIPVLTILHYSNNSEKQLNSNNKTTVSNNQNATNDNLSTNNNDYNSNTSINQNSNKTLNQNNSTLINDNNSSDNKSKLTSEDKTDNINQSNTKAENTINKTNNENPVKSTAKNTNWMNAGIITASVTDGCAPLYVQFTPAILSDTISYQWAFGDSKTSNKKLPSHVYTKSGLFTVTLTATFKKSGLTKKISYSDFITVKAAPKARFTYAVDKENVYTFTDNSSYATIWNWSLGDRTISQVENPEHEYTVDGSYNVTLIAYSIEGCADTSMTRITVKNKPPFYLPTGFSPGGLSDKAFGPTGVDLNPDGYKFNIYDKSSKLVFESTNLDEKWDGKIKGTGSDAPAGVYVVIITMKDKHSLLQNYTSYVTLIR